MNRSLMLTLLFGAVIANVGQAHAQAGKSTQPKEGHLGIGVESVPPIVYSQLPGALTKGQGVLIDQVAKDSPAAKAGLQVNDILLTYGDQKLFAPDQLVKLVRGDKPGSNVTMHYVRAGKEMTSKVTLDEAVGPMFPDNSRVFRFLPDERLRKSVGEWNAKQDDAAWESFDGIRLSRLDSKRWRAEIEYRTNDGKKQSKSFEGTREEIRKSIQAQSDLPANERGHLLRALNYHDPIFEFHFPQFAPTGFWNPL